MTSPGVFITFEGSEGCGKTTQIRLLAEHLRRLDREVVLTREPGGTPVGEQIRHTLQHSADSENLTPAAELLLFAASRAQLVREIIRPALDRGACVISDRFLDSTTVYQGLARQIPADSVAQINAFAVGDCLPAITFLLDLPTDTALARLHSRPATDGPLDRIERESRTFFEAVRDGYLALAASEPDRFRVLDASADPDSLAAQIRELLTTHLHGLSPAGRA